MHLYVDYGGSDGDWQPVAKLGPSPEQTHGPGSSTWSCDITLPTGEKLFIGAVYVSDNRSLNIVAKQNGFEIVSVGGFKLKETTYDPGVTFRTIEGAYVHAKLGV